MPSGETNLCAGVQQARRLTVRIGGDRQILQDEPGRIDRLAERYGQRIGNLGKRKNGAIFLPRPLGLVAWQASLQKRAFVFLFSFARAFPGMLGRAQKDQPTMPKRDAAYMYAQRDFIARAALECMLEKGIFETSLRDICLRAGVSIGALYIHFATKEDVIMAACALDHQRSAEQKPHGNWSSYIRAIKRQKFAIRDRRFLERWRLSLQFASQIALMGDSSPSSLAVLYEQFIVPIRASLERMHDLGVVSLPLGLEATAGTHSRLLFGTVYMILTNKDVDQKNAWDELVSALALTAGYSGGGEASD